MKYRPPKPNGPSVDELKRRLKDQSKDLTRLAREGRAERGPGFVFAMFFEKDGRLLVALGYAPISQIGTLHLKAENVSHIRRMVETHDPDRQVVCAISYKERLVGAGILDIEVPPSDSGGAEQAAVTPDDASDNAEPDLTDPTTEQLRDKLCEEFVRTGIVAKDGYAQQGPGCVMAQFFRRDDDWMLSIEYWPVAKIPWQELEESNRETIREMLAVYDPLRQAACVVCKGNRLIAVQIMDIPDVTLN